MGCVSLNGLRQCPNRLQVGGLQMSVTRAPLAFLEFSADKSGELQVTVYRVFLSGFIQQQPTLAAVFLTSSSGQRVYLSEIGLSMNMAASWN